MKSQVLVTFSSKHGATAEIAERIGRILRDAGFSVNVQSVESSIDLHVYKAVILGSAVYIGQWRKDAARFLRNNEEVLASQWVWLFSTGPTGVGDPAELMNGWRFPASLQPIADRIKPKGIRIVHGTLETEKLNFFEKWITKKVNAPVGDFRDWKDIASWANEIADELKKNGLAG